MRMDTVKDIQNICEKINNIDVRLVKMESTRPFLEDMIERNIVTNEKLAETLQDVQLSMVSLNEKMKEQSEAIDLIRNEFSDVSQEIDDRITKIDYKVEKVKDKGKFGILGYLQRQWPTIVILIGAGSLYLSKYIKF